MPAGRKNKEQSKPRRKPGRVPTACAECRRLKLRCDQNVPCQKCVSRGCGSICPDGVLTQKHNRMVLTGTEELHDHIDQLTSRIRELENTLQSFHTQDSDNPNPLLQRDYNSLSAPQRLSTTSSADPSPTSSMTALKNAHSAATLAAEDTNYTQNDGSDGSLTIHEDGQTLFFGSTTRSELLIHGPTPSGEGHSRLSTELLDFVIPKPEKTSEKFYEEILSLRPQASEAFRLCELYIRLGKVLYSPVPRAVLVDDILISVYRVRSFTDIEQSENLALLFIVFAMSTHFEDESTGKSADYYRLAKACLRLSSHRKNTLNYIQAAIHISQFLDFRGDTAPESDLEDVNQVIRTGFKMGLHFDSNRWQLPAEITHRRAQIFCELFLLDTWTSFFSGTPPSISLAFMDGIEPPDDEEGIGADGHRKPGLHTWRYKYAILLHSIMAMAFGPRDPAYDTILDLDLKIRDFPVPLHWRPMCGLERPPPSPEVIMIRFLVSHTKESTILNLHRHSFLRVLQESPEDPSTHPCFPSVLAIYRSAWRLLRGLRHAWDSIPDWISKVTLPWSQALSATVVMCLFVIRMPGSHLTTHALGELDLIIALLEESSSKCRAARDFLRHFQSLRRFSRSTTGRSYDNEGYQMSHSDLEKLSGITHLILISLSGSSKSFTFPKGSSNLNRPTRSPNPNPPFNLVVKDQPPSTSHTKTSAILPDIPQKDTTPFNLPAPTPFSLQTSSSSPPFNLSHTRTSSYTTMPPPLLTQSHSHSNPSPYQSKVYSYSQQEQGLHLHPLRYDPTVSSGSSRSHSPPLSIQTSSSSAPGLPQTTNINPTTSSRETQGGEGNNHPSPHLHPTILRDMRDFRLRSPPADSSAVYYFDFPPTDSFLLSHPPSSTTTQTQYTNVNPYPPSTSGSIRQERRSEHQYSRYPNDNFFQKLESSFQPLDYPPQPRTPFSASVFGTGLNNNNASRSQSVLEGSLQHLVEHLGFA